jgi:hypothetical protein
MDILILTILVSRHGILFGLPDIMQKPSHWVSSWDSCPESILLWDDWNMCAWPKPQFWEKHLVNQFGSGLNKRYRAYISTSCFLRERIDMDSEHISRVFRVTEFLSKGCIQCLENLGVKETPNFLEETTGAWTFSQTATEECCVKIMRIRTRFLVVSVLDICTSKTQKLCFLEPRTRTEGSFVFNSQ